MADKPKILVIVGTSRQGRVGRHIADWYMKQVGSAAPNMEFELLDLADWNLPVFNEPMPPMTGQYSELQQKLALKIDGADGFVFMTGEYNHGIPGALKNFLDYLFAEWNYKAAAFVGHGSSGGVRAIEQLVQVLTELKVASIGNTFIHIHIDGARNILDENNEPKAEIIRGDVATQLKELEWWVRALKQARTQNG